MSTAGKVLTVLILLVMIGWLVILAGVIQTNVDWEQKIGEQEKTLASLQDESNTATRSIANLTESTRVEQDVKDRDVREIQGRIAAAERRQSATSESLSRLKIQVADYLVAVQKAETNLATRKAEKVKGEQDLARRRDEIAKAQAVNGELRDQLARLQDEFKRLLADNVAKADRALKGVPATRPASTRRPSPST